MTVQFEAVQRPAAMLAEGLLGRPVRLEVADEQLASGRRLLGATQQPVIVLPPQIDAFGHAELDRRAFRHAVVHQAAYELFGTNAFDLHGFAARHPERPLLLRAFTAIEERRIDALVARRFPGAAADVARAAELDPPADAWLAEILSAVDQRGDLHRWTVDDAAAVALALCPEGGRGPVDLVAEGLELSSAPEHAALRRAAGAGDEAGDRDAQLENALGWAADVDHLPALVDAEGSGAGAELPQESPSRGPSADRQDPAGARAADARAEAPTPAAGERSHLYDEWDMHADRYLRSWCRVHERPLTGGDPSFIADVRRRHAGLVRKVRRQFGLITAESWRRVHRERDGGELDLDEVVASMVDRRLGIIDDEHLYIRQVRAAREVAAAFLLDMSASTSSPVPDPDAPPPPPPQEPEHLLDRSMPMYEDDPLPVVPERRVLDLAKESLALMCDALQILGDEHAIYGFSGEGRHEVEFYVAKELGEPASARTWGRLDAMQPRRYTRMGPAIRHATGKLCAHAARTRLLVVVSDGYPQDRDYGPDRADHSYGIADTAKALHEAERAGVRTFCITVDPAGHDYLRQMCPQERYAVIDDVTALPDELARLYRTLVGGRRRG